MTTLHPCPRCTQLLPPGAVFCRRCGAAIPPATSAGHLVSMPALAASAATPSPLSSEQAQRKSSFRFAIFFAIVPLGAIMMMAGLMRPGAWTSKASSSSNVPSQPPPSPVYRMAPAPRVVMPPAPIVIMPYYPAPVVQVPRYSLPANHQFYPQPRRTSDRQEPLGRP